MINLIATDMDGTLLDERGEVDLPRLERLLDHLDQKGIRFVIATGNEIHRMRQLLGPLVKRVTLVVANGARIFEDDQMILGKFWDRELVEAVLDYFKGRVKFRDPAGCLSCQWWLCQGRHGLYRS